MLKRNTWFNYFEKAAFSACQGNADKKTDSKRLDKRIRQASRLLLNMKIFCHHLPVEEVDDAVCKARVVGRVCHHDDGGTFLVELGE
jgi:hypothetical protein